jgi:hypothetical protein
MRLRTMNDNALYKPQDSNQNQRIVNELAHENHSAVSFPVFLVSLSSAVRFRRSDTGVLVLYATESTSKFTFAEHRETTEELQRGT